MSQAQAHPRRTSNTLATAPAPIPRAPPLPAPRPLQRARDAASRLLGYPSRPPSPHGERDDDKFARGSGQLIRYASLGLTQNATVSHRTGLEINTIAINDRGTHALLGGKDIFKTVRVEDGRCTEDFNLRTAIRSNPNEASGRPRQSSPNIDISDVAWAKGEFGDYIAAATTSGKIVLYNLGRADLQAAQLHDHARQVHRVTFNPHKSNFLLSGSQDGTVRLWDLRDARSQVASIRSKRNYTGQKSPVRDVKWSPTEGLDFACGTDGGDIQRWDMRDLRAPKAKISAHSLGCNAVDWHPDGKHIIGASSDGTVRVFDVSVSRPKKAAWEIKAPFPVLNARWRPACESLMANDDGARLCTQIVTSYDREHPVVHIWDFRRPNLPFREVEPYQSAPTDLLWHSQDLLWIAGREGTFLQTDLQHMAKVIDRRNLQAAAVSPLGELSLVTQRRQHHRTLRPIPRTPSLQIKPNGSLSGSPENQILSRSWGDDSLDHSFLSVIPAKRHSRTSSYSKSTSSTPALVSNQSSPLILRLDEILWNRKSFRPLQIAFRGTLPSYNRKKIVAHIAQKSTYELSEKPDGHELTVEIRTTFEKYALCARSIALPEVSKMWNLVGFWMIKHLKDRAVQHTTQSAGNQPQSNDDHTFTDIMKAARVIIQKRIASRPLTSSLPSPASLPLRSTLGKQLAAHESTSNVPTPLARPIMNDRAPTSMLQYPLPDPDEDDHVELPPSLVSAPPALPIEPTGEQATSSGRLTEENLIDLRRLRDMEEQSSPIGDPIERWRSNRTGPLNIDLVDPNGLSKRPKLEKHDSNESFPFLAGSTDSGGHSFPASFQSGQSPKREMVAERPSRIEQERHQQAIPDPSPGEYVVDPTLNQSMLFDGSGTLERSTVSGHPNSEGLDSTDLAVTERDENSEDFVSEMREGTQTEDLATSSRLGLQKEHPNLPSEFNPATKIPELGGIEKDVLNIPETANPRIIAPAHDEPPDTDLALRPGVSGKAASTVASVASVLSLAGHRSTGGVDFDLEQDNPIVLIDLLKEQLRHYTADQPYPQVASLLVMLVAPLLPRTHPLPHSEVYQTLERYIDYFTSHLEVDHEDIPVLLNGCFEQPIRAGLQPLQVESILSTYHEQLLTMRLFDDATSLRCLAYPAYPAVYEDFIDGNRVSLQCGHCGKPAVPGMSALKCSECRERRNQCAICTLARSPYEERKDQRSELFSTCLSCNHSGHAACYRRWFADVGGISCPSAGCLCSCAC